MRAIVGLLVVCLLPTWAVAQQRPDATLRVTVVDPSGAVSVGAQVTVTPNAPSGPVSPVTPVSNVSNVSNVTSGRGDAFFGALEPGRYSIHVESAGFLYYEATAERLRVALHGRLLM